MKHTLLLIIAASFAVMGISCIDKQYDLSNMDAGTITIGGNESEFKMPLVSLKISIDDIFQGSNEGKTSIKELYESMTIWLPDPLPNNAKSVNVVGLINGGDYFDSLFDALYEEMRNNEQKRLSVCRYIVTNFRDEFLDLLFAGSNQTSSWVFQFQNAMSDDEATSVLSNALVLYHDEIKADVRELMLDVVADFGLNDVKIDIPKVDISQDVMDMLSLHLDAAESYSSANALYLYGTISSNFPFKLHLSPIIEAALIDLGTISIDHGKVNIDNIRIYKEALESILDGADVRVPIVVEEYYPYENFDNTVITIHLCLLKVGGLSL